LNHQNKTQNKLQGLTKKVAVIIDWDNVRKGLFEEASKINKDWKVNYMDPQNVINLVESFIEDDEEIYRIFLYLTKPFFPDPAKEKKWGKKEFEKSIKVAKRQKEFIEKIGVWDLIALRKGKLKVKEKMGKPIFMQKQVDMLMGLDIAHLSYNRLVDRILILCGDTDIIPALKIARTNGIQIILGHCPDIHKINFEEIKFHSDFIREKNFREIFNLP